MTASKVHVLAFVLNFLENQNNPFQGPRQASSAWLNVLDDSLLCLTCPFNACWPHSLPSNTVSPLTFPSKTGRCSLSFSLNNLLMALNYPIHAAERRYCISNADSGCGSQELCEPHHLFSRTLLGSSYSVIHPGASSAPSLPTLFPRMSALPILLTLPVLLAPPLGHLPCFLLESANPHAWWACRLPGLMLNVIALQLSFYFLSL